MARPYYSCSIAILRKGLSDEDEIVRAEVAVEIGLRGADAVPVVEPLIRAAGYDESPGVRACAVTALTRLAQEDVEILKPLEAQERAASYPASASLCFARERVEVALGSC